MHMYINKLKMRRLHYCYHINKAHSNKDQGLIEPLMCPCHDITGNKALIHSRRVVQLSNIDLKFVLGANPEEKTD